MWLKTLAQGCLAQDQISADFSAGPHEPWISCDSSSTDVFSLAFGQLVTDENKMRSCTQTDIYRAILNELRGHKGACTYVVYFLVSKKVTRENTKQCISSSKSLIVGHSYGSELEVNLHISALIS